MTTAPAQDPLVGKVLDGRYRIEERVGLGGMGSVYRALHVLMERHVAIKVLAEERAEDPQYAKRFVREAKSTFRFDHPNCVRVTDFNATRDGILYIVMEYLDGRTVGQELHYDGPIQPARVAHIGQQVCDALAHAHALGFIHRDLKPDNIMLLRRQDDSDFVKVLDFGLAKFVDEGGPLSTKMSISPLTREGMVFGTPEYMSPEQASGKKLSARTDLYSLGVVVYQMLTGQVPFAGASFMQILTKHVKDKAVPPAQRRPDLGIPEVIDRLVMWCMDKQPDKRPENAEALSAAFAEAYAELSRSHSRIPTMVAASETMDLGSDPVPLQPSAGETFPDSPGAMRTTPRAVADEPGGDEEATVPRAATDPPDDDEKATIPRQAEPPPVTDYVPAAPPAREELEQAAEAAVESGDRWKPRSAGVVAHGPPGVTQMHVRRHRAIAITAVAIVFGAVAGVSIFLMTRDRPARVAGDSDSAKRSGADADAEPAALLPSDAAPATADAPQTVAAADIDAAPRTPATRPDGGTHTTREPQDRTEKKTARQKRAEVHLRNARSAPSDLKALSEAQAAYKLDRGNREVRILFGQLLVKTGAKERGCQMLKRYKRHWKRAGCAN